MKKEKLIKIINNLSEKKIGVVGDLMLDEFIWGDAERISPEAPIPVVLVDRETFMPGGAANTANNITSLGGRTFVVGSIGNDKVGDLLCRALKRNNINTEGVVIVSNKPTTQKTRIIARSQQIVRLDREKTDYIKRGTEEKTVKFIESHIENWGALIISDYGKGFITPNLARRIIVLAGKYKKPVIVDTKKSAHARFFKNATLITPNLNEAKNITGLEDLKIMGKTIQKRLNCSVLITQGAEGMTLFEGNGVKHFSSKAREVFDIAGAGDTVAATLALSLAAGASLKEAAVISNHAAGIVVGKLGIATVTQKELKNSLENE